MNHELTSQQVIDFANYMFKYFGLEPRNKRKSLIMNIASWFAEKLGYMSKENFLKNYTTVFRGKVYLPFTIGNNTEYWLNGQVAIIVHECQHAVQKRINKKFNYEYLFSTSKRAFYEADAYRTNMEMHFWSTKKLLSPVKLASKLYNYGCKTIDVAMAKIALERSLSLVKDGIIISEATKRAIDYLNKNMPEHKSTGKIMSEEYYSNMALIE